MIATSIGRIITNYLLEPNLFTRQMLEFTTKHIAKYRLKNNTHIVFSTDKLCYNIKTGRVLKQILKGSTIGYIIEGKFKSLAKLKLDLELIPKEKYPF